MGKGKRRGIRHACIAFVRDFFVSGIALRCFHKVGRKVCHLQVSSMLHVYGGCNAEAFLRHLSGEGRTSSIISFAGRRLANSSISMSGKKPK